MSSSPTPDPQIQTKSSRSSSQSTGSSIPIRPNPHPYAIKTTSTALLARSNSSGHNISSTTKHNYVPLSPSSSASTFGVGRHGRKDSGDVGKSGSSASGGAGGGGGAFGGIPMDYTKGSIGSHRYSRSGDNSVYQQRDRRDTRRQGESERDKGRESPRPLPTPPMFPTHNPSDSLEELNFGFPTVTSDTPISLGRRSGRASLGKLATASQTSLNSQQTNLTDSSLTNLTSSSQTDLTSLSSTTFTSSPTSSAANYPPTPYTQSPPSPAPSAPMPSAKRDLPSPPPRSNSPTKRELPTPPQRVSPQPNRLSPSPIPSFPTDLPPNPKLWTPTQVAAYLCASLGDQFGQPEMRLEVEIEGGHGEVVDLEREKVEKEMVEYVLGNRIGGRVFLRLGEGDLDGFEYRQTLLSASRNLRQGVIKGRIWGGGLGVVRDGDEGGSSPILDGGSPILAGGASGSPILSESPPLVGSPVLGGDKNLIEEPPLFTNHGWNSSSSSFSEDGRGKGRGPKIVKMKLKNPEDVVDGSMIGRLTASALGIAEGEVGAGGHGRSGSVGAKAGGNGVPFTGHANGNSTGFTAHANGSSSSLGREPTSNKVRNMVETFERKRSESVSSSSSVSSYGGEEGRRSPNKLVFTGEG
ncbi:hypothetical protein JAAARDRAFT_648014 [Jaapia argillacea MUCL 33604]|uniref:Uncharacterized protein n=1 Tax=Jaapia argillacea MUCL 33604 TaxID=933084 RepID=A0A067PVW1_9AGAM|nr:hypothetical protein JAAARDRAFT_648014 [Jaapia argillacea MUCL 33604]